MCPASLFTVLSKERQIKCSPALRKALLLCWWFLNSAFCFAPNSRETEIVHGNQEFKGKKGCNHESLGQTGKEAIPLRNFCGGHSSEIESLEHHLLLGDRPSSPATIPHVIRNLVDGCGSWQEGLQGAVREDQGQEGKLRPLFPLSTVHPKHNLNSNHINTHLHI